LEECLEVSRGIFPLVKVMHMVDSEDNAFMGFIYEETDREK
jgi:hypothetical protein